MTPTLRRLNDRERYYGLTWPGWVALALCGAILYGAVRISPFGLRATVTASGSGGAVTFGSVQFFDGVTAIGGPVALAAGTAVKTTTTLTCKWATTTAPPRPTPPTNPRFSCEAAAPLPPVAV